MSIIDNIKNKAKMNSYRIILPETEDKRVIEAGLRCSKEKIADIIFIGKEEKIKNTYLNFDFSEVTFIEPESFADYPLMVNRFYELRKDKGLTLDEARELLLTDYNYFGCMLVEMGLADGLVSGANHSSKETLKPALQIIKKRPDVDLVSAFFLMEVPDSSYGENGVFVFADAGLNQNPTASELAYIACSSSKSFELLVGKPAKVALLSHSTYGSSTHADVTKVQDSLKLAKTRYKDLLIDGELQLDAAIIPEVAKIKAPDSLVAGSANTLIFPNLDAGNIGYKLVERLAKAHAYGPLTQGLNKPINDLSRGSSVEDIIGVIAITALQCSLIVKDK